MKPRQWTKEDYLFPLDDAYQFGIDATKQIDRTIEGGVGSPPDDGAIFAQAIKNAGDGDYLELGTLFGGSAILAAMTKKKYGIKGSVTAIDDLMMLQDERNEDTIHRNAKLMGVKINLKIAKTVPFPFPDRKFNCVLIDAAHDFCSCMTDWVSVKSVATKYVMFHDYIPSYPGVMSVVKMANFYPVFVAAHTAVLQNLSAGLA
jgi:hypothetical protein